MPPPSSRIWLHPTNHSWAEALGNEHGRCRDFVSPYLITIDRLVRPFDREEVTLIPAGAEVNLVTQEGIQRDHGEV